MGLHPAWSRPSEWYRSFRTANRHGSHVTHPAENLPEGLGLGYAACLHLLFCFCSFMGLAGHFIGLLSCCKCWAVRQSTD